MSTNKNQTAVERAKAKAAIAEHPTRHACHECRENITRGTLFPVLVSQRGMVFYHRDCARRLLLA